jgi:predicted acylesterase/phospholipase RssA
MPEQKPANLGLQGGGTHGAFTWGVHQPLLEEHRFAIEGVSATSAGAMNAVVPARPDTLRSLRQSDATILFSLITAAQRAISSSMNVPNSCGLER